MILSELKNKVISLDFEDSTAISGNAQLFADSVTQALETISKTVKGVDAVYEYTPPDRNGIAKLDLLTATIPAGSNTKVFDRLLEVQRETDDDVVSFNNYKMRLGHIVIFDKNFDGKLEFIYRKRSQVITSGMVDSTEIDIDYEVQHLLPLLTAYYMWLDNDIEYASRWYNEYEKLANDYLAKTPIRISVRRDLWKG